MKDLTARDVMTERVLTVQADWPVTHLTEFLLEHGISGAPVTTAEGTLIGVVSLTDIVRHESLPQKEPHPHGAHDFYVLSLEGRYAEEEWSAFRIDEGSEVTVRDIMTPTIFKVHERAPVREVADLMIKGRIHRVFVTRGDTIVGIVTALDLLQVIRDGSPRVDALS